MKVDPESIALTPELRRSLADFCDAHGFDWPTVARVVASMSSRDTEPTALNEAAGQRSAEQKEATAVLRAIASAAATREAKALQAVNAKRAHAVSEGVEQADHALEAAERLGLIGVVADGPHDLATNPEYLKGFGS